MLKMNNTPTANTAATSTVTATVIVTAAAICLIGSAAVYALSGANPFVTQQIAADGVREVVSRAPEPLPPPWELVEDLVIGVEYGPEEYMVRRPRDFTVLEDGTHVILDDRPVQFRIYDSEGTFIRAFGQAGQGPTDIQPFSVDRGVVRPAAGDEFEIWSRWPTWRQTWNISGSMVSVETLDDGHHLRRGRGPRIMCLHGSRVYALTLTGGRGPQDEYIWTTHLMLTDWAGTRIDTLRRTEHTPLPFEVGWFLEIGGLMPMDQVLSTSTGRLYVTSYEEDWIREIDPETGEELLRFRWEHEPDSFTALDLADANPNWIEQVRKGFEAYRERVSIMYLGEGPDGEIWVQRIEWSPNERAITLLHPYQEGTWPTDIFSAEGEYRGRMNLPFAARHQKMVDGALYAISRTGGGAPALIRYRLEPER